MAGRFSMRISHADAGGGICFELRREDGAGVELLLRPRGGGEPLVRTAAGDLVYRRFEGMSPDAAAAAGRAFGAALDGGSILRRFPHLDLASSAELASVAGRAELSLDAGGVVAFLAPELRPDGDPFRGGVLRAVYDTPDGPVLELAHADGIARARLAPAGVVESAFARPAALAVVPLLHGGDHRLTPDIASLFSWLALLLVRKQGPGFRVVVPPRAAPVAPDRAALEVALTLNAECGQSCAFCSIKSFVPPHDGGEAELASHRDRLRAERGRARRVRLTGIEPLAFSRILDLVSAVTELGYETLAVESPARRLADPTFAGALAARAPRVLTLLVPLYGAGPAEHDAVTGVDGSHAEVLGALDVLRGLDRPGLDVVLTTVVGRQNAHGLPALVELAASRGLRLESHLPYPLRRSPDDAYARAALPEEELVARVLGALVPGTAREVTRHLAALVTHPCILRRAEQRFGLPLLRPDRSRPALNDAREGAARFVPETLPCPHAERCPLRDGCSGEQYALHADLFGMDDLRP